MVIAVAVPPVAGTVKEATRTPFSSTTLYSPTSFSGGAVQVRAAVVSPRTAVKAVGADGGVRSVGVARTVADGADALGPLTGGEP